MASWGEIESLTPDLARLARGSPRISGIEAKFIDDDLWFGSMPGSRKGADLARDPRFALHGGSIDPPGWEGDAKLSGLAEEVADDSSLYRTDLRELTVTRLTAAGDELAIDFWSEAGGVRSLTRK